ncbi:MULTISPECIES: hypothetical protein [Streptomyces]|uniref:hypothetical protein n=1 Tax=Streptomyces TaxID=1883 RepID=UPI002DDB8B9E|nr:MULTISPECIES: hypothetical protein [unclassified Streptomyces]WSD94266.1 hypothetical protein OG758_08785 [Streptomyces sp. NBC_01474]
MSQSTVRSKARDAEPRRQTEEANARQERARRELLDQRRRDWLRARYGVEDMDAAAEVSGKDWFTILDEWLDQH